MANIPSIAKFAIPNLRAIIHFIKLQIVEGMWNGFDFINFLDRINRIIRNFFARGEGLSAEGRIIRAILRARS